MQQEQQPTEQPKVEPANNSKPSKEAIEKAMKEKQAKQEKIANQETVLK